MASITPVAYPLNLGTANDLSINLSFNSGSEGGRIFYTLNDNSIHPGRRMSSGIFLLTQSQITDNDVDVVWALNYAASKLGVTLT
jgi:hypothetical protein